MGSSSEGTGVAPEQVDLPEPVRHQLVSLAADVLGRLPADEIPAGLRAIARFAPAKRARLGATALAASLDSDDTFRDAVAAVVATASPQLAAAVADGLPTGASDPIDVALVAYLTRPSGWDDVVRESTRRWAAEQGVGTDAAEADRLRGEIAELRAAARHRERDEARRTAEAVETAIARAEAELVTLRRTVRERTRELRAAERAQAEAADTVAQAQAQLAEQDAAHELELRRLRGRISEADRTAEAARRGARVERDVDDARLWLLVDTIVQAASGVRRELSLSTPAVRPSDVFAATEGAAKAMNTGRAAGDPSALDAVLALPNVHVVVDGYNVTKTGYPELSLADQRTRLMTALAPLAARSGAEVTVVFDGAARPPVQPTPPRGVRVLFSAAEEIADDLIRRIVAAEPAGRPVALVTSDRQIVTDTASPSVWAVPSAVLLARLG